jgi:hypothetical protein
MGYKKESSKEFVSFLFEGKFLILKQEAMNKQTRSHARLRGYARLRG